MNFGKKFVVDPDASHVVIDAVLSQDQQLVAFYGEKLHGALRYSTYDMEFYAIIQALRHWRHYLKHKSFVLNLDHEAINYINGQHKLNSRHG